MTCYRCAGLMVPETTEREWLERVVLNACLNCGERYDTVIAANRDHHIEPRKAVTKWGT